MSRKAIGQISRSAHTLAEPLVESFKRILPVGQPVHDTHPQLLGEGELQPGVHLQEFKQRRNRLAESIQSNSVVILPSADLSYIVGVIPHYFRQDTNFLYMTGINQQAIAAIETFEGSPGEDLHKLILFLPILSEEQQIWEDVRMNVEAAVEYFGAAEAYPLSQFRKYMDDRQKDYQKIFFDMYRSSNQLKSGGVEASSYFPQDKIYSLSPLINQLRYVKSAAEQKLMQTSVEITTDAIKSCIQMTTPGVEERILKAHFDYLCKLRGAQSMAFPAVVASGSNACSVHYGRCDSVCQNSDLLLMDAGCEYFGYVSDVSRTWPVNGRFTPAQHDLYQMIHDVYQQVLGMCKPGTPLKSMHATSVYQISDGLQQLGLLSNEQSLEEIVVSGAYKKFYPHSVGHWLGLDCHDTPTVRQDTEMKAGAIVTVEPGVYIPNDEKFGEFGGTGIRLEDDVLITEDGYTVLSNGIPLEAEKIAAMVGKV